MSLLYSTCSTPRSISQLSVSAFDEKASELEKLKKDAVILMKKVNTLKIQYMEWWANKNSSFLNVLRSIQMFNRNLCPQSINCMADYEKVIQMANIYHSAGKLHHLQPCALDQLQTIQSFWGKLEDLKTECKENVLEPVTLYCCSITRLREPRIKDNIDRMMEEIDEKSQSLFDFTNIHNAKDNLFTYKLSFADKDLIGFIGFIPHLTNLLRKLCYLITKLHVEKE